MKTGKKLLILVLILATTGSSCKMIQKKMNTFWDKEKPVEVVASHPNTFNNIIKVLAGDISGNIKEFDPENRSIVVTTFVDINDYDSTTPVGRYISERLIHELHLLGYRVFEPYQAKNITIVKNKGAFHLTRDPKKLWNKYRSDGVVVGTYALVHGELTLHARMLERDTSRILSVATATFSIEGDVFAKTLMGEKVEKKDRGTQVSFKSLEKTEEK